MKKGIDLGNQTSLKTFQRGGCNSLNPPPPPPPGSASVFKGLTYNDKTLQFEIKNVLYFIFLIDSEWFKSFSSSIENWYLGTYPLTDGLHIIAGGQKRARRRTLGGGGQQHLMNCIARFPKICPHSWKCLCSAY